MKDFARLKSLALGANYITSMSEINGQKFNPKVLEKISLL